LPYIFGTDRSDVLLFPEAIDDYITAANPVRFIDAFVSSLDLITLGFTHATPAETGRPAYHPADLLRLYIYGYLNRVRSSRLLERETHRNVEVMWLLGKLTPDFKTIADFRKDNLTSIKQVCREFTLVCKKLELFGGELIAVDGSKFKAVNNRKRNFSEKRLAHLIASIDEKIASYIKILDEQDKQEVQVTPTLTAAELQKKIVVLKERKTKYEALSTELAESGEKQVSLTDPDARSMVKHFGVTDVCYNVQTAVDAKHKLIVEHEVTNNPTDHAQLSVMAVRTKERLQVEEMKVVADMGYFDGAEVKKCDEANITAYVAKPQTSSSKKRGLYTKEEFTYAKERDVYLCPQGEELTYRFDTVEQDRHIKYYATPQCRGCPAKADCTTSKAGRRITRLVDEDLLDEMAQRVKENPQLMKQRQQLSEHPFGTMKRAMNSGYFLMRGLKKVSAEMSLTVLSYNIKRVINIIGVEKLIEAVA
jgi:transposase